MEIKNPFPTPSGPTLAVFDFDGTLAESDTFWPFLGFTAGWPRTAAALFGALRLFISRRAKNKNDPEVQDHRTFIKAYLLDRLLKGRPVSELAVPIGKLRVWIRWKESVKQTLLAHCAAGHHVVIASGGLDLYLPELLRDLPHHGLICTQVGIKDGVLTGEMVSGNCVRDRKAELVADYIARNGPYTESWGYGNLPHDLPMLNLLRHRVVI